MSRPEGLQLRFGLRLFRCVYYDLVAFGGEVVVMFWLRAIQHM